MQSIQFALLALKLRFDEFKDKERGATAVEYGLMVALVAAAIITVVTTLGTEVANTFQDVIDAMTGTGDAG